MTNQIEIFNLLAVGLIDDIPQGASFEKAVLDILCLPGTVEFKSYIITSSGDKTNLDVSMGFKYAKAVLALHDITQTQPPIHTNWNRAKYTLFPEGRMEIEYIWDEELQMK